MYGTKGASTWADAHSNSSNSTIKGVIDSWYNTTTNLSELSTKLSHTAGFCGDRSSSTSTTGSAAQSGGYGTTVTYYGAYVRVANKGNPTFKCTYASNDLYTTPDDSGIGNKKLSVPIGLITADEVVFAGGVYNTNNKDFYLYTGSTYWTMSPFYFYSGYAGVFVVTSTGYLSNTYVANTDGGVRPVINLKADVTLSGSGIISSPYTVS